jgi:hypothetical protein
MPRLSRVVRPAAVPLFLVLGASLAHAISVTIVTPAANTTYAYGATVAYSGSHQWSSTDGPVATITMYTLGGSSDPTMGTVVSSNTAHVYNVVNNADGSGSGQFDSANVTPSLVAPSSSGAFYLSAQPASATSLYYPNGRGSPPYFQSVSLNVP